MPVSKHLSVCSIALGLLSFSLCAQPLSCREPESLTSPELTQLWQDFVTLSSEAMQGRKSGTEGARLAREYIVEQYRKSGLTPLHQQPAANFDSSGWLQHFGLRGRKNDKRGANVIGKIPGAKAPLRYIILTAHYDHLGTDGKRVFNGANDNASGVAAMLYIARMLQHQLPANSVLFVATDNEEDGLYGAKAFVEQAVVKKSQILLNVNLDMIAQPGKKWRLYVSGTRSQPWLGQPVDEVIAAAPVCVKRGNDGTSWNYNRRFRIDWRRASDHWEFARRDIPWLYLGVKDYRYYHTSRDTADKIPKSFYFGVAHSSFLLIIALDHYFNSIPTPIP